MTGRIVLAVVAAALLLPAAPAGATSCAVPAPLPRLQAADAAIVGEMLPRGEDGSFRWAVRDRIKGDVEDVVVIAANANELLDLNPPPGTVTGIYLRKADRAWSAGICDQVAPRALRAAAQAEKAGERCHVPSIAAVRVTRNGRHVRLVVRLEDRDGRPYGVRVSFGDSVSENRRISPRGSHSGVAAFGHRFRADRAYRLTLQTFSRARPLCGANELSARRRMSVRVTS